MTVARRINVLVVTFTCAAALLTLCATLKPRRFSIVVIVDTSAEFGAMSSIDYTGRCYLGKNQGTCAEMVLAVLHSQMTGYESEEDLAEMEDKAARVERAQTLLLSTQVTFHLVLLIAYQALWCLGWQEDDEEPKSGDEEEHGGYVLHVTSTRRAIFLGALGLSTVAGATATVINASTHRRSLLDRRREADWQVAGLAVGLQAPEILTKRSAVATGGARSVHEVCDVYVGAGWIITLLATLGCLFTTVTAARLLSRPRGWSDIGEGRIVLPPDDEDDGDQRERQLFQPGREKAEYVRGPSSI